MYTSIKLWAKFKLIENEHTSITYTPVIAWENKGDGEYIAIVLRQPSMHDSDTAYTVDHSIVRKDYGKVVSFVLEEKLKDAIDSTQDWVNKDTENRSIYIYPSF